MERWRCRQCGALNRGEHTEPCAKCGLLRKHSDPEFARQLLKNEFERATIGVPGEIRAGQERIGKTSWDRLNWLVGRVYVPPFTPEAWKGFERDIYFLGLLEGRTVPGVGVLKRPDGQKLLNNIRGIIQSVLVRDPVQLPLETRSLYWWPGTEQEDPGYFLRTAKRQLDLEWIALDSLYRLIMEYGHLIKKCPAPAIRAKHGETCGKWFLAKRPNQDYCNPTCVSRKTTRDNPPKPGMKKNVRKRMKKSKK